MTSSFWSGRRVLVTGHTGFKGAWLALWLTRLGARVSGYSLAPVSVPNLYMQTQLSEVLTTEFIEDIRDSDTVEQALGRISPDCVFHLAAQTEVRESYRDPLETFSTNIQGTVVLLERLRRYNVGIPVIVVTSDKCYRNAEIGDPFVETDPLGGGDPYSASKACQEIVTEAMCSAFFGANGRISTARAGNVLGGGDWAAERLVPDVIRATNERKKLRLRYPDAVRPWQYVLDLLSGYLQLAEWLSTGFHSAFSTFNFGPSLSNSISVRSLVARFEVELACEIAITISSPIEKEARALRLNAQKAHQQLNWEPSYDLSDTVSETVRWYRNVGKGEDPREASLQAISRFQDRKRRGQEIFA